MLALGLEGVVLALVSPLTLVAPVQEAEEVAELITVVVEEVLDHQMAYLY